MKHVGKMKNNNAKVVVVYRTLPGDPYSALVVGTGTLGETYHDALMSVVQEDRGQQANELADVLAVKKFPDGENMLSWLHNRGHLKKVPTNGVLITPHPQTSLPLDELNALIAEQKGVSLEDLALLSEDKNVVQVPKNTATVETLTPEKKSSTEMTPAELRSRADSLYKEASKLRKLADELDPPKKKSKVEQIEA